MQIVDVHLAVELETNMNVDSAKKNRKLHNLCSRSRAIWSDEMCENKRTIKMVRQHEWHALITIPKNHSKCGPRKCTKKRFRNSCDYLCKHISNVATQYSLHCNSPRTMRNVFVPLWFCIRPETVFSQIKPPQNVSDSLCSGTGRLAIRVTENSFIYLPANDC